MRVAPIATMGDGDYEPQTPEGIMLGPQKIVVWVFTAMPTVLFCALFSAIGIGDDVYRELSDHHEYAKYCFLGAGVLVFLLYTFDIFTRFGSDSDDQSDVGDSSSADVVSTLSVFATVGLFSAGSILSIEQASIAPLGVFMLLGPMLMWLVRKLLFPGVTLQAYLNTVGWCAVSTGMVCLAVWVAWWETSDLFWEGTNRDRFKIEVECHGWRAEDTEEDRTREQQHCLRAFLLWVSPFILGAALLVFGLFLILLSKEQPGNGDLGPALKAFFGVAAVGLAGVWISASIGGSSMQLSNVVMLFAVACVALSMSLLATTQSRLALSTREASSRWTSDPKNKNVYLWMKAAFILAAAVPLALYGALSWCNERVRRLTVLNDGRGVPSPIAPNSSGVLTTTASGQLNQMRAWDWAPICRKIVWLGILFFGVNVGAGKMTTLFLSWLNAELDGTPLGYVTLIIIGVGLTMFLLPPVPGVPVYLTGGIVITEAGRKSWGFYGAMAWAIVVCYAIKLTAIVLQQTIGYMFERNAKLKAMVGVDPPNETMTSVKEILETPGLGAGKVMILIGGPDWPTSVLTGILKLPYGQMLLGSLPVIVLTAPCTVAGAFQLRTSEGAAWEALAALTLALAAGVQAGAGIGATYFIAAKSKERDGGVAVSAEVRAAQLAASQPTSRERVHPTLPAAAALMAAACYLVGFNGSGCFETFAITDKISCTDDMPADDMPPVCLHGNALNLVKVLGWVAIGLFGAASLLFYFSPAAPDASEESPEEQLMRDTATKQPKRGPVPPVDVNNSSLLL